MSHDQTTVTIETAHKARVARLAAALGAAWSIDHRYETYSALTHSDGYTIGVHSWTYPQSLIRVSPDVPNQADGSRYYWADSRLGCCPTASINPARLDTPEGAAKVSREFSRKVIVPYAAVYPTILADIEQERRRLSGTLETALMIAAAIGYTLTDRDREEIARGRECAIFFDQGRIAVSDGSARITSYGIPAGAMVAMLETLRTWKAGA